MKKILLTATVQSHIAQFHKPLIDLLQKNGYEVHVAARNNLSEKNGLNLDTPNKIFDIPFARSPINKNNINAYRQLKKLLDDNNYDVVHCNTPMGGVITRLAAKKHRLHGLKVFYTAHGFHFYKGAPLKNWLIYYPIEKLLARYTDKLITIVKEDYNLARTKFKTNVIYIHGVGANSDKYYPGLEIDNKNLRKGMNYEAEQVLILCVGELNKNKNQSTVIKAMAEVVKEVPNAKLILAGNGPMEQELKELAKSLDIEYYVEFLGYRADLENFMQIADIVVSASFREGLPLNIVEAALCMKPVIISNNRGHKELISQGINGYLINPNNSKEISDYIIKIIKDKTYNFKYTNNTWLKIEDFTYKNVVKELEKIYDLSLKIEEKL